ncbi:MAG: hypothetical protein A2099_06470 [Planctomycetes bacterium GWF2_39_10]|nr:MAG: hypothetical protein A3G93_14450 [Nitrospinae bacterium RIFCSPLOWO2_12_FULL_45_22]OHB46418.1 MAG: hypothetical protein A2099_06470 [Planctomycetes bacterium GWF2_39_10]
MAGIASLSLAMTDSCQLISDVYYRKRLASLSIVAHHLIPYPFSFGNKKEVIKNVYTKNIVR